MHFYVYYMHVFMPINKQQKVSVPTEYDLFNIHNKFSDIYMTGL